MSSSHHYDIHGIMSIVSPVGLPELAPFRTETIPATPSLVIKLGKPSGAEKGGGEHFRFSDLPFGPIFGMDVYGGEQVRIYAARALRFSPHVLYTNIVEPVVRWYLAAHGYALLHGACIASGSDGIIITAKTDTGKTTTILQLLETRPDLTFLSDDFTLIDRQGRLLAYPKPLTISSHTVRAVSAARLSRVQRRTLPFQSRLHSRGGRRTGQGLARLGAPAASMNAVVQALIPPPKYFIEQLIPEVRSQTCAQLKSVVVIERGPHRSGTLAAEELDPLLAINTEDAFGFPPYDDLGPFLQHALGTDLVAAERAIVREAVIDVPGHLFSRDDYTWSQAIQELMPAPSREPAVAVHA